MAPLIPFLSVLGAVVVILAVAGLLPPAALVVLALVPLIGFLKADHTWRLVVVVLTIAFPLVVPLLGKDGGTVTTFLIFGLAGLSLIDLVLKPTRFAFYPIECAVYLIAFGGVISLFDEPADALLSAIRFYYIALSGMIIFLLVIKASPASKEQHEKYILRILHALIVVAVIQIGIGFLIYFVPSAGTLFNIFLPLATEKGLQVRVTNETIARFTTLITGPEPTGEMLAMLAPLVLHLYFWRNKPVYLGLFAVMAIANILTATRSANILFALASLTVFSWYSTRVSLIKITKAFVGAGMLIGMLLAARPEMASNLMERFSMTPAKKGESVAQMISRDRVWAFGVENLKDLPPFGHGFARLESDGIDIRGNFHSLYLTSLYQMGWIGAPVFWFLLLRILWVLISAYKSTGDREMRLLAAACLVAMTVFLVNEIKYEFNRHQPYLQFVWTLLGLLYVVGILPRRMAEDRVSKKGLDALNPSDIRAVGPAVLVTGRPKTTRARPGVLEANSKWSKG